MSSPRQSAATEAALQNIPAMPESIACDEDGVLLARLRAGDDSAYEELVQGHGGRMLATARRMVRREEDAHDIVQEAFLLAFRSLPAFEGRSRVSTWLHRIVVNVALMKLRSRRRRPEVSIDDELPQFRSDGTRVLEDHDATSLDPAGAYENATMKVLLRSCLERLPDVHRTVIVLRDMEDLTTEETAEILGIRPVAVKVRLHRARQALKTLMQKELGDRTGR